MKAGSNKIDMSSLKEPLLASAINESMPDVNEGEDDD
jgi:hypothetical protein